MTPKTRQEKEKFIRQYMQGKASVEQLLPAAQFLKLNFGDRIDYFINRKRVSKEVYEQALPWNAQKKNITLNIRHPRDTESGVD